jgi:hypothetical protein
LHPAGFALLYTPVMDCSMTGPSNADVVELEYTAVFKTAACRGIVGSNPTVGKPFRNSTSKISSNLNQSQSISRYT